MALGAGDTALTIDGIVGRVKLVTDRRGRRLRRDTEGTTPGVLYLPGAVLHAADRRGPRTPASSWLL